MFYIEVKDESGTILTFDAFIEKDEDYIDIYIGDTHGGTRMNACVHLILKENDMEATLDDYNYRQTCNIHNNLTTGNNTHLMLKGALKYLTETYPYIKRVSLSDVAQKKGTRVYLTPRRLLIGKPGWYEEYFGAIPSKETSYRIKKAIKSFIQTPEVISQISKQSWGKADDLEALSREAGKLIHSDWIIMKDTINNYPIKVRVIETMTGGKTLHVKRLENKYLTQKMNAILEKYNHKVSDE